MEDYDDILYTKTYGICFKKYLERPIGSVVYNYELNPLL